MNEISAFDHRIWIAHLIKSDQWVVNEVKIQNYQRALNFLKNGETLKKISYWANKTLAEN